MSLWSEVAIAPSSFAPAATRDYTLLYTLNQTIGKL